MAQTKDFALFVLLGLHISGNFFPRIQLKDCTIYAHFAWTFRILNVDNQSSECFFRCNGGDLDQRL